MKDIRFKQSINRKLIEGALCTFALLSLPALSHAGSYDIDSGHTYPSFSVSHLGFSIMRGRFNQSSGSFDYDPAAGTASVEVIIDTASIDTGHDERDEHLRGEDFFAAAEFPEIVFKSTEAEFAGENLKSVTGDLAMHGVTKPVTLMIDSVNCGAHPMNGKQICGFNASASLVRSEWNMNYGIPAIGEEIDLLIEAEGVLKE